MKASWLGLVSLFAASAAADRPLQLCVGDGSPWPPYTYWQETSDQPQAETLTGYATELVLQALDHEGIAYELVFMPWARVQHELAHEGGRCEAAWDASYNEERAAFSWFSRPLYSVALGYLYIDIEWQPSPELSASSTICGVQGYNYEEFADHPRPSFTAENLQSALRMLQAGRCDFLASEIEPVLGGIQLGQYELDAELGFKLTPLRKEFHAQVSRFTPNAERVLAALDNHLAELKQTGELEALAAEYLIELPKP